MTEGGRKRWGKEKKKFFYESHGKQHGGPKGEWINPLPVQRLGSNSSIEELQLLIYKGGLYRLE